MSKNSGNWNYQKVKKCGIFKLLKCKKNSVNSNYQSVKKIGKLKLLKCQKVRIIQIEINLMPKSTGNSELLKYQKFLTFFCALVKLT